MACELKYRPIISRTAPEDRKALLNSYLKGDGYCPACGREGRKSPIEERYGESVCERDGAYAVCVGEGGILHHGVSLDD